MPSMGLVAIARCQGGFFFEFEAIRTESGPSRRVQRGRGRASMASSRTSPPRRRQRDPTSLRGHQDAVRRDAHRTASTTATPAGTRSGNYKISGEARRPEVKVYKQRVKHLLYEHQDEVTQEKTKGEEALSQTQTAHRLDEAELR